MKIADQDAIKLDSFIKPSLIYFSPDRYMSPSNNKSRFFVNTKYKIVKSQHESSLDDLNDSNLNSGKPELSNFHLKHKKNSDSLNPRYEYICKSLPFLKYHL